MTLRDEIARAVARAVDRALDGERAMTPPPLGDWHPLVTDAADDILATVREALLSDDAVNDASFGYDDVMYPEDKGTQNALYRATERDHQAAITSAITAALDAVTGEGGER